jgi:hypothetical protein
VAEAARTFITLGVLLFDSANGRSYIPFRPDYDCVPPGDEGVVVWHFEGLTSRLAESPEPIPNSHLWTSARTSF